MARHKKQKITIEKQIENALKKISFVHKRPDERRTKIKVYSEEKQQGLKKYALTQKYIFSKKSYDNYKDALNKYCKEICIKNSYKTIDKIKTEDIKKCLENLVATNKSNNYILHIQEAFKKLGHSLQKEKIFEKGFISQTEKEIKKEKFHIKKQIDMARVKCLELYAKKLNRNNICFALQVIETCGCRASEINKMYIDTDQKIRLIGKNGKVVTPTFRNKEIEKKLYTMATHKPFNNLKGTRYINMKINYKSVQNFWGEHAPKFGIPKNYGLHSLRYNFVDQQMKHYVYEENYSWHEASKIVSQEICHNRPSITEGYYYAG